ncbi:MAG: DUF4389 domain-containing protein [Ectothiorhodospiraceae bacterium]|nr:DUF4389 domain-containing protein [Ectothiorhodospiraceae bacterium]
MDDELKQNVTAAETWIRGLFILLFAFLLVIARMVTAAVVVIQFLFTVFSGQTNENLRDFGASLAQFIFQALMYVTYNSDDKPFPFRAWPEAKDAGANAGLVDNKGADESGTESADQRELAAENVAFDEPSVDAQDERESRL